MSRKFFLLIVEGALISACGLAAVYIRFPGQAREMLFDERAWLRLLLSVAVAQGSFYLFDLYDFSMIRMRSLLAIRILQSLGLSAIILALIFYLVPQMEIGRSVFFLHLLLMSTVMTGWRLFAMRLLGNPRLAERVLVVGTDRNAVELAREVLARREEGFYIVGFV